MRWFRDTVARDLPGATLDWDGQTREFTRTGQQLYFTFLLALAAKNAILIVEFANQLRDCGLEFIEATIQAAVTRLGPVLMTSLCTAFGALPLMLATGARAEQRRPIGMVVFFGMTVAVFLTLFAVPTVYSLLARKTRSPQHVSRLVDRLMSAASGGTPGAAVRHDARRN